MRFTAIRFPFLFLIFYSASYSNQIEFYADWAPDATGTSLFSPKQGWKREDWPALWTIQARMKDKGWELKSWDLEFYRPILKRGQYDAWNAWRMSVGDQPNGIWVFWNMGGSLAGFDFSRMPKEKLVLFMWEPPTVQQSLYDPKVQALFGKIFTWDDDLVDNQKFFQIPLSSFEKRDSKKSWITIKKNSAS